MGKFIQKLRKSNLEDKILIGKIIALAIVLITLTVIASIEEKKKDELLINTSDSVIILLKENERLKSDINELKREVKGLRNKIDSNENEVPNKVEDKVEKRNLGTFKATAYTSKCKDCSGITKSGYDVRNTIYYEGMRVIATDPKIIPLYSIVEIEVGDETFKAIALDIGGAIKGKRIDLLVDTKDTAYKFGIRDVEINMIREGV